MSYANMDGVPTQTAGTSEILAADWNTYVRDNFDSIKFGHLRVANDSEKSDLGAVAEGTMVYQTDNQKLFVYNGDWVEIHDLDNTNAFPAAASDLNNLFGAWTNYSSSLTVNNFTKGNATYAAQYLKVGRLVHYRGRVTLGSTSVMGTSPNIALPSAAATTSYDRTFGSAYYRDAGTRIYVGMVNIDGTGVLTFNHTESGNNGLLAANDTFVWTSGDEFGWSVVYEASS